MDRDHPGGLIGRHAELLIAGEALTVQVDIGVVEVPAPVSRGEEHQNQPVGVYDVDKPEARPRPIPHHDRG